MVVKKTFAADVTIIGAGIIGLKTATLLKKSFPDYQVLVLDQSLAGSGASFYGGAADVPFAPSQPHRDLIELGRRAQQHCPEIITPSYKTPTYWIADNKDVKALHNAIWPNDLLPLTQPDFHGFPLQLAPSQSAFFSQQGSVGSPYIACRVLLERLRQMNATVIEGMAVKEIEPHHDGRIRISSTRGHSIYSRVLILAVGPWLPQFSWLIPNEVQINTKKIIAFHINRPRNEPSFCIQYFLPDMYFIPDPIYFDRWLFCVRSEEWECLPVVGDLHISPAEFEYAHELLKQYAPKLNMQLQGGRVFCDAYTSDSQPYISQHPNLHNLIIAGACSGSGYRLSAGIAQRVSTLTQSILGCI